MQAPPHPVNFNIFFVEMGFSDVAQAGLELLSSNAPPTAISQSAGITDMSHCAQPIFVFLIHTYNFGIALIFFSIFAPLCKVL